jgi:hypothetical protein
MVGWESLGAWAKTLSYRFVIHHLVHKDWRGCESGLATK